jgi:hypothetical protein
VRDSRLITIRRGRLTDVDHRLLAEWALSVLSTFSTCLNATQKTTRGRGRRSTKAAPGLGAKCTWRTPAAQRLPRMPRHEVWEGPPSLPPSRLAKPAAVAHVAAHDPRGGRVRNSHCPGCRRVRLGGAREA